MSRLPHFALLILLLIPHLHSSAQVTAPPRYKATVLQQYDRNGAYISIGGINNRSDYVYGNASDSGFSSYSYLKYASGGGAGTTLAGAWQSGVYGFNDLGDVVGYSYSGMPGDQTRYPVTNINGVIARPDADGTPVLSARGINNSRQIVGTMTGPGGARRGYIYDGNSFQQLGTFGGANSDAFEINNAGQVIGSAETADGAAHAFLYENGNMIDLTTRDGLRGTPTDINDAGQIIGTFRDASGDHAFFFGDGEFTVIGDPLLPSEAAGINNHGQVVGLLGGSPSTPFLWQEGQLYDLTTLFASSAYYILAVGGINDVGEITLRGCGAGPWPASQTCSLLLLSPVPEPSGLSMLLAGLLIVMGVRRRRRNETLH